MSWRLLTFGLVLLLGATGAVPRAHAAESVKGKFDKLVEPLMERGHTVGVIVAVIDGNDTEYYSYGTVAKNSNKKPDPDTVFAIGSITKTFTALLLADMAERRVMGLDTPIQALLPLDVSVPKYGSRQITLGDLASHVSGLPRMPSNWDPAEEEDPYADYDEDKLYEFISAYELTRKPGDEYEYSNLGFGLLGHILSLNQKMTYERLVVQRICWPLKMIDTHITVSASMQRRQATGHDIDGTPVRYWTFNVLEGCGAFYSTARDMARYLRAEMGLAKTPLSKAMVLSQKPRSPAALPGCGIGLGWHTYENGNVAWHDGGTIGFYAYAGFDKERKFGFVWLSNSSLWQIGALRERLELILLGEPVEPLEFKKAIDLDPEVLPKYVGTYRLAPDALLNVTLVEGYLVLGTPGQRGGSVLYAESETDFFFLDTESVTVSFEKDANGNITKLIFHEEGEDSEAVKVSDLPTEPKTATSDE